MPTRPVRGSNTSSGILRTTFIVILLSVQSLALADSVSQQETVRLVTGPHYPPFAADGLPAKGLGPYLVNQVLMAIGREATIELRPWKRAYRESLEGRYDAALPYIETSERREDFLFSKPVFKADTHAYVMADSDIEATSMEGLKGLTYCNPLGFADGKELQAMRSKGDITRLSAPNLKSCFQMLAAGRIDFIKINRYVADYTLRQLPLAADQVRALPFLVERISLHLMVPETRPGAETLIYEFDSAFTKMKSDGRIQKWAKGYLQTIESDMPKGK